MSKIKRLSPLLINQIAAGECIERPASVVKELVENSIDAGATNIEIQIEDAGNSLIQVLDNGCGMDEEDLKMSLVSHATSKICTADDLLNIHSLGFRGEAIASIASIAEVSIASATENSETGMEIVTSQGEVQNLYPIAMNKGTKIEVHDLFFNVPARRKFLKSKSTEMAHITETIIQLALPNPHISFLLTHGGKKILQVHATEKTTDRISSLFGIQNIDFIFQEYQSLKYSIQAYLAPPQHVRNNNKMQYCYINGRSVQDRTIFKALQDGYHDYIPDKKFAIAVLFLQIHPLYIDVNVHPTKAEVRHRNAQDIYRLVYDTVRHGLQGKEFTVPITCPTDLSMFDTKQETQNTTEMQNNSISKNESESYKNTTSQDSENPNNTIISKTSQDSENPDNTIISQDTLLQDNMRNTQDTSKTINLKDTLDTESISKNIISQDTIDTPSSPDFSQTSSNSICSQTSSNSINSQYLQNITMTQKQQNNDIQPCYNMNHTKNNYDINQNTANYGAFHEKQSNFDTNTQTLEDTQSPKEDNARTVQQPSFFKKPEDKQQYKVANTVLQIDNSYIIVEVLDGIQIIDQHALHERILYEELKKQVKKGKLMIQPLLFPLEMHVTPEEMSIYENYKKIFPSVGLEITKKNNHTLELCSLPQILGKFLGETFFRDLVEQLPQGILSIEDAMDKILATMACKAAIKAGDALSPEEITSLLQAQDTIDNPYQCPHGRPTTLTLSANELKKYFHRT